VGRLSDRLALLCAHLDLRAGEHSQAVLLGMRVAGITTLALLAALLRRRRGTR
jgi:protein SCO1/2